jgi:hypothetical protein
MTAETLAEKTDPRYLREWLSRRPPAATWNTTRIDAFSLTEEQALALAQEGSPAFIPGAFQIAVAQFRAIPKMLDIFRNGRGLGWHEHDPRCSTAPSGSSGPATRRIWSANGFRRWKAWTRGSRPAQVADVGCGHGIDDHHGAGLSGVHVSRLRLPRAVDPVCDRAASAPVSGSRDVRSGIGQGFPGSDYDLATCSTACTTWAIRWARRGTSANR